MSRERSKSCWSSSQGATRWAGTRLVLRAGLRPDPGTRHDDAVRPVALHYESSMPTSDPSMTSGSMPLLVAHDLIAGYGRGDEILKGVHLTVDENEIVAIIGPNGAGKSTLLKTIA